MEAVSRATYSSKKDAEVCCLGESGKKCAVASVFGLQVAMAYKAN